MRLVRLTTACGAALLVACATGYKPESLTNIGGYSEEKRGPGVWQVWFVGNGRVWQEKSDDFALLRGAELCLAEGKPFMRAGKFTSYAEPAARYGAGVAQVRSAVEVTCLAEKSVEAQDAATIAADIRQRYSIAPRRQAS